MEIKIKNGMEIPLKGKAEGKLKELPLSSLVALDLSPFETMRFNVLKKIGERVKKGEPLAEEKSYPKRLFVSPASGKIKEVIRGEKRRLLFIVIETVDNCSSVVHSIPKKKDMIKRFMECGLMPHIQVRPCSRLAHPEHLPETIFVKALESAPYMPPSEMQVIDREKEFSAGLYALSQLSKVHLVYRKGSTCKVFTEADYVEKHQAEGPHPISNFSVHIASLNPILKNNQIIWCLDVSGVLAIGKLMTKGVYESSQVISVSGEGVSKEKRGFYRVNRGTNIGALLKNKEGIRIISGDPLMGEQVDETSFLGFFHQGICTLAEEKKKREFLHFLKMTRKGYTATNAYLFNKRNSQISTHQHGETRTFIDNTLYDRVMPLPIHTMSIIKAVLAGDFDKAEKLGLLEVAPEDFALPSFLCPSKIEMTEIIKKGQQAYSQQYFE